MLPQKIHFIIFFPCYLSLLRSSITNSCWGVFHFHSTYIALMETGKAEREKLFQNIKEIVQFTLLRVKCFRIIVFKLGVKINLVDQEEHLKMK